MVDPITTVTLPRIALDGPTLALIVTALTAIIGALAKAVRSIIRTLHETKILVAASAHAEVASGKARDAKIQEIHLLVNSRLLTALRLLVMVTRKEADRTQAPGDVAVHQQAEQELRLAEAAARTNASVDSGDLARVAADADAAVARVTRLLADFTVEFDRRHRQG